MNHWENSVKFRLVLHWGGVRKEGGPIFRLPKTWEEPITLRPQSLRITHMSPLDPSTGGKKSANKTQKNDSDQTHHPSGRYWRSFLTGRHVSLGRWIIWQKHIKKSAYIYGSQCLPYAKPAPFTYYTKQTRTREIHLIFSFINRTNVHNICVTEGKRALLLLKLKESQSHDGPYLSVCV